MLFARAPKVLSTTGPSPRPGRPPSSDPLDSVPEPPLAPALELPLVFSSQPPSSLCSSRPGPQTLSLFLSPRLRTPSGPHLVFLNETFGTEDRLCLVTALFHVPGPHFDSVFG